MESPLLGVADLHTSYGAIAALRGVSLEVPRGGVVALIGANGAGKSTLMMTIFGNPRAREGSIVFAGRDITRLPPHLRARLGLGWVPQEREIFPSLTVDENLTVAARHGPWDLPAVYRLFPRLEERRGNMGNQLSGGEQQMLAIARTLLTNPSALLLDEPLEVLAPIIVEELTAAIARMAEAAGVALILVEQHTAVALALTREAVIIERGRIAHREASATLLAHGEGLDRYVGLQLGAGATQPR